MNITNSSEIIVEQTANVVNEIISSRFWKWAMQIVLNGIIQGSYITFKTIMFLGNYGIIGFMYVLKAIDWLKYPLHPYVLIPAIACTILWFNKFRFTLSERKMEQINLLFYNDNLDNVMGLWAIDYYISNRYTYEMVALKNGELPEINQNHSQKNKSLLGMGVAAATMQPQDKYSIYKNKVVLFVGLNPKASDLVKIADVAKKVIIFNSVKNDYASGPEMQRLTAHKADDTIELVMDNSMATCQIVWDYMFPKKDRPVMLEYLADNISARYKHPYSKDVGEYLRNNNVIATNNFTTLTKYIADLPTIPEIWDHFNTSKKHGSDTQSITSDSGSHGKNKRVPPKIYKFMGFVLEGGRVAKFESNLVAKMTYEHTRFRVVQIDGRKYVVNVGISSMDILDNLSEAMLSMKTKMNQTTTWASEKEPDFVIVAYWSIYANQWVAHLRSRQHNHNVNVVNIAMKYGGQSESLFSNNNRAVVYFKNNPFDHGQPFAHVN